MWDRRHRIGRCQSAPTGFNGRWEWVFGAMMWEPITPNPCYLFEGPQSY